MSFLDDPRLREERRFIFIVLPILLLISAVLLLFLLREKKYVTRERGPAPSPTAVPSATPPPIPTSLIPSDQPMAVSPPSTPVPAASAAPPVSEPAASPVPSVAADESSESMLMKRALAALGEGKKADARRHLLEAVVSNEDAAEASNVLGTLDYEDKKWKEALENFSAAVSANEKNPIYLLNRSEALRRLGRYQLALGDLEAARVLAPRDPLFPNKLLLTRLEAGEKDQVFKEVQSAIALNMSAYVADALGAAAAIEMEAGNMPQGIGYLLDLRGMVAPLTFNIIVTDQCFKAYADRPEFKKLLPGQ